MEVIVYDVNKICRSCLKEQNELISVFEVHEDLGENVKICEIIKTLVNLEVSLILKTLKYLFILLFLTDNQRGGITRTNMPFLFR